MCKLQFFCSVLCEIVREVYTHYTDTTSCSNVKFCAGGCELLFIITKRKVSGTLVAQKKATTTENVLSDVLAKVSALGYLKM